jgi:hypothetical protein
MYSHVFGAGSWWLNVVKDATPMSKVHRQLLSKPSLGFDAMLAMLAFNRFGSGAKSVTLKGLTIHPSPWECPFAKVKMASWSIWRGESC